MADTYPFVPASAPESRFGELFNDCSGDLLAYALRRVAQPADAADVVAETFVVAWRRLDDVPAGAAARLWLFGVARRVLANQRRGQVRRLALADHLRAHLSAGAVDPWDDVVDATGVGAALASLSDDDRELLQLTSWEGLTPGEVATVLGIPPPTARTRLHRARNRLRNALEGAGHGGDDERVLVRDLERDR